ncbi:hypothetical protein Vafri_13749 [Volvox africanus]|uniref:Protein kinase domain-containing protein n=1 Tax=Volvox africanus TaxID=51714 RepID=A0A8J4BCU7_9CHLO|nr:hypothetical protein Vafri_13749 [Volvox africanus]
MRRSRCTAVILLLSAICTLWQLGAVAEDVDTSELPHVDSCNYCYECVPMRPPAADTTREAAARMRLHHLRRLSQAYSGVASDGAVAIEPEGIQDVEWANEPDPVYEAAAAASGIPGALTNPNLVHPELIQPSDHDEKQLKPNCTRCTGCTTVLSDMHAEAIETEGLEGIAFMHGKGATNGWLFFGNVAGSNKRYIVKVYCMPYSKLHGRPQTCASKVYMERMRLMMAQVRLADECGANGITPRVWIAPVNAIIPNGTFLGYHVRWYGLWMEEAPGITLHGLFVTRGAERAMFDLLTNKINMTQVVQQTVLDLLTAQCDRHSENVFITPSGALTFIDNDRALGVVTRCGSDSMLLPGNRYHTQLRLGYWGPTMTFYETHGSNPGFCTGPIDMRVVIDYRCYVPDGRIDRNYYPEMRSCMKALARHAVADIMHRYGFTSRKPAEILKRRSRDMLLMGFEAALETSPPRSAPRYMFQQQPPCCNIVMDIKGTPMCATCWKPIIEPLKDSVKDMDSKVVDVLVEPGE